ncbi:MAG: sigma-54-dependent Fis family transcriptional regulator, partial [Candidatus Saccharibacteria bacterium]
MEDKELRERWKLLHRHPEMRDTLSPEIRDSWERSYDYGVNPGLRENPYICTEDELARYQMNSSHLIETTQPVMDSLFQFVAGTGFVVVLGDANNCLLKVVGDPESLAWAKNAHLIEGSLWAENLVGTNAGSLAIALGRPISVYGYEHFCL